MIRIGLWPFSVMSREKLELSREAAAGSSLLNCPLKIAQKLALTSVAENSSSECLKYESWLYFFSLNDVLELFCTYERSRENTLALQAHYKNWEQTWSFSLPTQKCYSSGILGNQCWSFSWSRLNMYLELSETLSLQNKPTTTNQGACTKLKKQR